jgi:ligand-binding sensor domain-containing protein
MIKTIGLNYLSKLSIIAALGLYSFTLYSSEKQIKISPQPTFKQFTIDQGLPSNEIYHIIQDSLGFIWIATANGVSRFDGNQFKNYGVDEGLVESTIHELYIDYRGRLWFISNSGRLAYYENEQIVPFQFNHRINEFVSKARGTVKKSFFVDSIDNVHLSLKNFGRIMISAEGIVTHVDGIIKEDYITVEKMKNGPMLISTNSKFIRSNYINFIYPESSFRVPIIKYRSHFHFSVIEDGSNSIVFNVGGLICRVVNGVIIDTIDFGLETIWLSLDTKKNIWVAPFEGGIHMLKRGEFYNPDNMFMLSNAQITSTLEDNEGGHWFTSLNNGVFYCPNINLLTFNQENGLPNNRINAVYANRNGVFIGDESGVVSQIRGGTMVKYSIQSDTLGELPIRFIGVDSTSAKVWICSSVHIHSLDSGKIRSFYYKTIFGGAFPRQMIPTKDGFWLASSWGIKKFTGSKFVYSSRESNEFSSTVYSVYEDSSGDLWMATANGVWKYRNKKFEYLGADNQYFVHTTSHIAGAGENLILFATKGIGLLVYNGKTINRISQSDGLASNFINKIFVANNAIWLATNNGISCIEGDINNEYIIKNIGTSHGLPTNEINNIFVKDDDIFVATTKGLTLLNNDLLSQNIIKPRTRITGIRVSGKDFNKNTHPVKLTYAQNYIAINFIGLAYKNMGKVYYRYRLLGLDSTWIYTQATNSIYTSLSSGNYTFEVQSQNSDGLWGDSATLSLSISPPYWQTYWFIILATLIFTGVIYLIYKLRIKDIKRRNELMNNLNIYKQKSLRQQMNPHFIFNTLNSIQLYILEKDHISSHKYLTKFAKLMRLVLDNSQQSTIELSKEIEALRLYLELESIRLSGKFEYQINIENDELLKYKVPTLLIQPFVENSIWHGIMLKPEQDGLVSISIKSNNQSLLCTIEDNGIGRKAAQEIRKKQDAERKSLGFKITAQRIELLNTLYKDKFNIKYIDINDSKGNIKGTRVEIMIPYTLRDDVEIH